MTRKRFIKLMMAHGYQRNLANYLACEALENYKSYQDAWDHFCKIQLIAIRINEWARHASQVFSDIITSVSASMRDIASAVSDMRETT